MNEAIKKAIEGGWKYHDWVVLRMMQTTTGSIPLICLGDEYSQATNFVNKGEELVWTTWEQITSQTLFWQALGKSLDWPDLYAKDIESHLEEYWRVVWHSFIDHLASGKDPEDFFKELLTK